MLRNYLKIAWRNLWKNKAFSFLNISGLAIGMASAILILLWIQNEVSYDRFHKNDPYLYEAWNRGSFDGTMQYWNATPKVLGPTLKKDYPEIADVARTNSGWFVVAVGEKKLSAEYLMVDPSFLSLFSFPMVKGNPATALNSVYSVVITEKMAKKMFGNEDPMNKTFRISKDNLTVSGVLKDLPTNTRFQFDYLLSWEYLKKVNFDDNDWGNNSINTFVQLKPNVDPEAVNAKIRDITKIHSRGEEQEEIFLHPESKWHLYSRFENKKAVGGEIETVRLFGMIAAFILLIACINFMNLSTARSENRAREVGIRKVAGAYKSALILQFLGESLFIVFISGVIALLLVQLFLPSFDLLINKQLLLPYDQPAFWLAAISFVLITGLLAGSYPAFFLSSFKPVSVLKGTFKKVQALVTPRKVLVILQFSFAIILVISTLVVMNQIRYAQNRNAGYDRSRLVYHFLTGDLDQKFPLLKNELLSSGIASNVSRTSAPLTEVWSDTWGLSWEGKKPFDKTDFLRYSTDEDLAKTAGLKIVQGRDMNLSEFPTDSTAVLLNETAAKAMGFKNPLGQLITDYDRTFHVVGVLQDFIVGSPYEPMRPVFIEGSKSHNGFNVINIKLGNRNNTAESMARIEILFRKYNPNFPFEYHFVDAEYARKFEETKRTATLSALFAGLTILISCLGLFGLASFVAAQRTKEIGVRKVLGASVINLWQMLSKDFVGLILISLCIAVPTAYYFMHGWLQNFQYRTVLSWWIFASAGAGALAITLITVSYQSIKAALANPVKSLRSE
ncbi:MAG: ABC transporter permease [Bacteroidota bacterium]|nr:ABC transporter permease [Bacteroidota bacterium]